MEGRRRVLGHQDKGHPPLPQHPEDGAPLPGDVIAVDRQKEGEVPLFHRPGPLLVVFDEVVALGVPPDREEEELELLGEKPRLEKAVEGNALRVVDFPCHPVELFNRNRRGETLHRGGDVFGIPHHRAPFVAAVGKLLEVIPGGAVDAVAVMDGGVLELGKAFKPQRTDKPADRRNRGVTGAGDRLNRQTVQRHQVQEHIPRDGAVGVVVGRRIDDGLELVD